jgi:hypothetical protein
MVAWDVRGVWRCGAGAMRVLLREEFALIGRACWRREVSSWCSMFRAQTNSTQQRPRRDQPPQRVLATAPRNRPSQPRHWELRPPLIAASRGRPPRACSSATNRATGSHRSRPRSSPLVAHSSATHRATQSPLATAPLGITAASRSHHRSRPPRALSSANRATERPRSRPRLSPRLHPLPPTPSTLLGRSSANRATERPGLSPRLPTPSTLLTNAAR